MNDANNKIFKQKNVSSTSTGHISCIVYYTKEQSKSKNETYSKIIIAVRRTVGSLEILITTCTAIQGTR